MTIEKKGNNNNNNNNNVDILSADFVHPKKVTHDKLHALDTTKKQSLHSF